MSFIRFKAPYLRLMILGAFGCIGTVVTYFLTRREKHLGPDSRPPFINPAVQETATQPPPKKDVSLPEVLKEVPTERPLLNESGVIQAIRMRLGDTLSERDALIVVTRYNNLVSKREQLELSVAQREDVSDGIVLITIPEFYESGIELYLDFREGLLKELDPRRGIDIAKAADQWIRTNNADFGAKEQHLLVEKRGDTIHIVHGSGVLMRLNNQPTFGSRTSISNLRPENLSKYTYLRSLFPTTHVPR